VVGTLLSAVLAILFIADGGDDGGCDGVPPKWKLL